MGLLDHLLDGFGGGGGGSRLLRHNLRGAEALLRDGERAQATIVGIRVRRGKDDAPDDHEFALAFGGAGATVTTVGCRQRLGALAGDVRLGMEVPIRHDGSGRAIIEAAALGSSEDATWGYKALGDPPDEGIRDDNVDLEKERRKAAEVRATVLGLERSSVLGMATQNVDLRVRVEGAGGGPYETVVKRMLVPFYATHLAEPGTSLPALARPDRPDKVRIDWPAAAVADPGLGRPAAPALSASARGPEQSVAAGGAAQDWSATGLAQDTPDVLGGVSFETWVAVEAGLVRDRVKPAQHEAYAERHGVVLDEWAAARGAWQQRMRSDPRVGARFGAEYQAALKRR